MRHPSNQQHLLQFVNLLKGSDFGKAHFPRDLMQASHFSSSASTATVEVLSTNAAAKVRVLQYTTDKAPRGVEQSRNEMINKLHSRCCPSPQQTCPCAT